MQFTQREVQDLVHKTVDDPALVSSWGYHRATEEVESEVKGAMPLCDSPVIAYPCARMLYFISSRGELAGVTYEAVTAHPKHVHDDPRNYTDDAYHFTKHPLSFSIDEA